MPEWARTARIAGAAVYVGMTQAEIDSTVAAMKAQNVSVIEADSQLSDYMTDSHFDQELALMRQFASSAHAQGLRVGWYYPTLEVLTPNGRTLEQTMAKDHPDWVQRGLDGTPNVFYGGLVFWVEDDMESAWMSPSSPGYRDYYLDRVRRIAGTGLDYLWGDVPLLNDVGTAWADTSPASASRFSAETGLAVPSVVNWADPTWRRWVAWRHGEITDFLTAVGDAARSVNPGFLFIVETVTMDYASATKTGLEGAGLKDVPGTTHVWELDALSDANAMRAAKEDDWVRLIAMNKYARGASGGKPAWIFTYGKQADDARLVMAESLAAGNNPYETKIPLMATTVGQAYRTGMFGWVRDNEQAIFGTQTAARVAILYSPESRDFVDRAAGESLYATTTSSDDEFWSTDAVDSVLARQYLAEYTGMVKVLVSNHVPFDVIVRPTAQELARYEAVILPDVEAISDAGAGLLRSYTDSGGHLIATGPNPTGWDENGSTRSTYALADVLGLPAPGSPLVATARAYGSGGARYLPGLPGRTYLTDATAAGTAEASVMAAVHALSTPWLTTDANPKVHMELRQSPDRLSLVLHHVNFIGVSGSFTVVPTTVATTVRIPADRRVASVELTSPDAASPARVPVAFTQSGQDLTFSVPVTQYAMVVITLAQTPAPWVSPSVSPSGSPSGSASGSPSGSPSGTASGSPSGTASGSPSGTASGSPSGSPTDSSSASPTGSPSPSLPSPSPSGSPSSEPTAQSPSLEPAPLPPPAHVVADAPAAPATDVSPSVPPASARVPAAATVVVRATSGRSKLRIDVDPNKAGGYWRFKVQYLKADGSWAERRTTYRTQTAKETRTLDLRKGTYRVRVLPKYGLDGSISTAVRLRR